MMPGLLKYPLLPRQETATHCHIFRHLDIIFEWTHTFKQQLRLQLILDHVTFYFCFIYFPSRKSHEDTIA